MTSTIAKLTAVNAEDAIVFVDGECESNPIVLQNFIDGEFQAESSSYIDSFNPKTGKLYAKVPSGSEADVDNAVRAAEKAFSSWSKTRKSHRSSVMNRIADLIAERKENFAIWESIDQGKTLVRARVEIDRAVSNFRYSSLYFTVSRSEC